MPPRVKARGLSPLSDSVLLDRIVEHVTALERLCNEIERSLRQPDWQRLDAALADTRRTMHEFENAMGEAMSLRTSEFDRVIFARLQRVYAVRQEQMKRLQAIHDATGEKLRMLSRWKTYARSIAGPDARKRNPTLLDDVR